VEQIDFKLPDASAQGSEQMAFDGGVNTFCAIYALQRGVGDLVGGITESGVVSSYRSYSNIQQT
jgi:hypothetical protein